MEKWRKNIREVVPYVPGEQPNRPGMVKLNTNENPYPPAPGVEKALKEMDAEALRLYPDPGAGILTETLAAYYGLEKEQVFVGVGSDDVIAMAFLTFFNSDQPILFPDITYSFYKVWAGLYRIPYLEQPLDEKFKICPQDYEKINGGIILPNPNAPTGIYEPLSVIEEIIEKNTDVIVIIDEAYVDFGGKSALELISKYENLLVVQTFSKARSMAGIRIGYAMGNPKLIKALNDIKHSYNSYTMNFPSLVLGAEAVKDDAYFKAMLDRLTATREHGKERLKSMGFEFTESIANFLFVRHPQIDAKDLFQALKEREIYVRYFPSPRIDQYLRISIGTDGEMEILYEFLEEYLKHEK